MMASSRLEAQAFVARRRYVSAGAADPAKVGCMVLIPAWIVGEEANENPTSM